MPEGLHVEVAHKLTEKEEEEEAKRRKHRWEEVVEVIEVLVLALAAIATAWSGFQASQWDDRGGLLYGQATTQRGWMRCARSVVVTSSASRGATSRGALRSRSCCAS